MDPNIPVSHIMTREVITLHPNDSMSRVHDLFMIHPFHHLIVLEEGSVVGIVSRIDYLKVQHMLATTWGGVTVLQDRYEDMCVCDIMTPHPVTIESGDTVGLAADIFHANSLHALPVVDDASLVGIITSHDLLSYAFQEPI